MKHPRTPHNARIPHDAEFLHRLHWDERLPINEMAARFGVTPKALSRVMKELNVLRRIPKARRRNLKLPPDVELRDQLFDLYWIKKLSLPQIAAHYGVAHESIWAKMVAFDIPRRPSGGKPAKGICIECGKPAITIRRRSSNKTWSTRCEAHWKAYRSALAMKRYYAHPEIRTKYKLLRRRYWEQGAINPKGEKSWLIKARALLRTCRRLKRQRRLGSLAASRLQNEESRPEHTSRN